MRLNETIKYESIKNVPQSVQTKAYMHNFLTPMVV